MPPPSAKTVADRLKDPFTRSATLDALECHQGPHEHSLAIAAAAALSELMAADAKEVAAATFQRAGLLRARLLADEAPDDLASLYGAAFGEGRLAAECLAPSNMVTRAMQKEPAELDREDALCLACQWAYYYPSFTRGMSAVMVAAGFTQMDWIGMVLNSPLASKQQNPTDEAQLKLCALTMELLRSPGDTHPLAISGAWIVISGLAMGRAAVGKYLVRSGLIELSVASLRATGSPGDWQSISRGNFQNALSVVSQIPKAYATEADRQDKAAIISSGLFDLCLECVVEFEQCGVAGLGDTHHDVLYRVLALVMTCMDQPGCEAKVRSVASGLLFCVEHSLDLSKQMGMSTGTSAAMIAVKVFGRDEGDSQFTFTQEQVDEL